MGSSLGFSSSMSMQNPQPPRGRVPTSEVANPYSLFSDEEFVKRHGDEMRRAGLNPYTGKLLGGEMKKNVMEKESPFAEQKQEKSVKVSQPQNLAGRSLKRLCVKRCVRL